jgi:hypothetical protein
MRRIWRRKGHPPGLPVFAARLDHEPERKGCYCLLKATMGLLRKTGFSLLRAAAISAHLATLPGVRAAGLIQVKAVMLEFVHSFNTMSMARLLQMNL